LEVTRVLAEEIDLSKILDKIVGEACRGLNCERAILYQLDAKRDTLFATAGVDCEVVRSLGDGIPGAVARSRQMLNIAEPNSDPRWDDRFDRLAEFQTRSVLAVPLVAARDGRLLGVLEMLNNIGGPFDSDDECLALAFSHHAAAALDRARLVEELQRRRESEASLNAAREVQRRFMPSKMPMIAGYDVATWWYPQEAVGGDYCDVVALPSGQIGLCVADVCGHGLGPSLLMASVRASIRSLLLEHSSPQLLMDRLGMAMAEDFSHGAFVTMVLALLDPPSNRFTFANAGHAPAMHYSAATSSFVPLESTGLPIGVVEHSECPLGPPIDLAPGDLIVLGTDGIIEAMDSRGEQFGVERLQTLIRRLARAPIQELVRSIGREVELHYVGDSPPDDLTILALRRGAATQ
jgi:serine phosphatase RsbU (regulator of sigma subunit)